MEKLEKKKITKKKIGYDWLTNYIPNLHKKALGDAIDKINFLFKTNSTKDYSKQEHVKNAHGNGKKPRQLKIQK